MTIGKQKEKRIKKIGEKNRNEDCDNSMRKK